MLQWWHFARPGHFVWPVTRHALSAGHVHRKRPLAAQELQGGEASEQNSVQGQGRADTAELRGVHTDPLLRLDSAFAPLRQLAMPVSYTRSASASGAEFVKLLDSARISLQR